LMLEDGLTETLGASSNAEGVNAKETPEIAPPSMRTDEFGFPLRLFTKGSIFHPYLSIDSLDLIRSNSIRAYCIGITNSMFLQRREFVDAVVSVRSLVRAKL